MTQRFAELRTRTKNNKDGEQQKIDDKQFAKRYLQVLVDEIVVSGDTATMKGCYAALAHAVAVAKKMGTSVEVPNFIRFWCARSDSNARPLGS
ncbi:MAG: Resolvase domain [Proteobacteria bacterium]|nr:Resolvase domain [Pseudomonadota bacterium]